MAPLFRGVGMLATLTGATLRRNLLDDGGAVAAAYKSIDRANVMHVHCMDRVMPPIIASDESIIPRTPLFGLPVAVKQGMMLRGVNVSMGGPYPPVFPAPKTEDYIERLLALGVVVVGQGIAPPFNGRLVTRHWLGAESGMTSALCSSLSPIYVASGSSGGNAVVTELPSIVTDRAGSARGPAGANGLFSVSGVVPHNNQYGVSVAVIASDPQIMLALLLGMNEKWSDDPLPNPVGASANEGDFSRITKVGVLPSFPTTEPNVVLHPSREKSLMGVQDVLEKNRIATQSVGRDDLCVLSAVKSVPGLDNRYFVGKDETTCLLELFARLFALDLAEGIGTLSEIFLPPKPGDLDPVMDLVLRFGQLLQSEDVSRPEGQKWRNCIYGAFGLVRESVQAYMKKHGMQLILTPTFLSELPKLGDFDDTRFYADISQVLCNPDHQAMLDLILRIYRPEVARGLNTVFANVLGNGTPVVGFPGKRDEWGTKDSFQLLGLDDGLDAVADMVALAHYVSKQMTDQT
ncbi:MAG: amidase family protein [bacterium]|nr:amidase family protein [bacterium]